MDIGAGLLGKTHHVELAELSYLAADNLRVIDPTPGSQIRQAGEAGSRQSGQYRWRKASVA
ncbi:Uncharacterised protein [Raoultella planticola]|uniref:Uncharacterized protein n=1 Tax=Raoultella planticola TaxID=575 RepID=A0A485BRL3_RAOPL|nr:Uncharacterised protein [Raoultella planticola]